MTITAIKPSFAKGELSPSVWGRTDLAAWAIGASVERNCFVSYRGPASSRAGLAYVSKSLTPAAAGSLPPRIIRFQFNIYQSYILEFGVDGLGRRYMRVIANGGLVTDTTVAVTAVASSDPVAISATNTFAAGDYPFGSGFPPGTPLNREVVVGSPTGAGFVLMICSAIRSMGQASRAIRAGAPSRVSMPPIHRPMRWPTFLISRWCNPPML